MAIEASNITSIKLEDFKEVWEHDKPYTIVKEGKAEVLFPSSNQVFYNPVQEFNRDISIAVIKEYSKEISDKQNQGTDFAELKAGTYYQNGIRILEGLAASGLRSIRFGLEIPGVKNIVANDFSRNAMASVNRNIAYNNISHLVTSSCEDAAMFMYQHRKGEEKFDIVDIDPYGSPVPFLDAAVQCVKDGGLLLVTCTDTAVLCGNSGETCYAKYGAMSLKSKCCHEMALRIILQCIEAQANRYSRYIVPVLSLSVDFYVRVFVRIYTSQATVKHTASKVAMVYQCTGCESFHLQPLGKCKSRDNSFKFSPATGPSIAPRCSYCNFTHQLGGPIWASNLHDKNFVGHILEDVLKTPSRYKTAARILGVLSVVQEELEDAPLYYVLDRLNNIVHTTSPKLVEFRSALLHAGYKVSLSHACKTAIKTNALPDVIWDIMRSWEKLHPVKKERLTEGSPAKAILSKESSLEIKFSVHPDANPPSRLQKLLRFQENPEKDWGPKMRAKSSFNVPFASQAEKRMRAQNKRTLNSLSSQDYKIYPCKRFKQGICDLGEACRYSHVTDTPIITNTTAEKSVMDTKEKKEDVTYVNEQMTIKQDTFYS